MHPRLFAATLPHRCDAGVLLDLLGCAIALPLFPKRDEQARCSCRARARQGLAESLIGMTLRPFGNGVIAVLNRFEKTAPLCNQRLRHEGMGPHAPLGSRQRHGALDGGQALMQALLPAPVRLMKELCQCPTPGALSGFEGWPLAEKVTKPSRVLLGKPLEHRRAIHLQRPEESIGSADPIPSQATPGFHPWGQGAPFGTLGHEGLELVTVPQSELEREFGIGRIVLRAARRQGVALSRPHHRIEVKEHETVVCP
jgi:hypothetical protein